MNRLLFTLAVLLVASLSIPIQAVENQTFLNYGAYWTSNPVSEGWVKLSSTTATKFSAVRSGVYREFQNVSDTNLNFFYDVANTTNTIKSVLTSKGTLIEDRYFGDIYFMAPAGVASSTMTYLSLTNK